MAGRRPQFALDLSDEKVALWHRKGSQGWAPLGEVFLSDPDFGRALAVLRDKAPVRGRSAVVRLPRSQVLLTKIRLGVFEGDAAVSHARKQIAELTPYSLEEIAWDLGEKGFGNMAPVAVVARKTLREAEAFVRKFGFEPLYYTTEHSEREFPREPRFWLEEPGPAARRVGLMVPLVSAAAVGLTAGFLAYSWLTSPGAAVTTELPSAEVAERLAAATGAAAAEGEAEQAPPAAEGERVAALAPTSDAGLAEVLPDIAPELPPPAVSLEPVTEDPYPDLVTSALPRHARADAPEQVRLAALREATPALFTEPSQEKTVALRVAEARRDLPEVDLEQILAPLAAVDPFAPAPGGPDDAPKVEVARLSHPGVRADEALDLPELPPLGESKAEVSAEVTADPPPLPRPKSLVTAEPGTLTPTPEGTLGPDNILIFSGRPPKEPPARPGSERVVAPDPLAGFRPKLRPEGLVVPPAAQVAEVTDAAEAGAPMPYADPALAGKRPRPRPEGFADLLPEPAPAALAVAGLDTPDAPEATAGLPDGGAEVSPPAALPPQPVLAALPPAAEEPLLEIPAPDDAVASAGNEAAEAAAPEEVDLLSLADPALRRFRAPPRPEGLAPAAEEPARPEPETAEAPRLVADPALKRFRPRPRPAALEVPAEVQAAETPAAGGQAREPQPGDAASGEAAGAETAAADPPPDLLALADPALAGKRPPPRPAGLAPAAPAPEPEVALATDPALAGKRPKARPESLAILADLEEEGDEAAAAEGDTLAGASPLAVVTSPQPRARPARIAAVARRLIESEQREAQDTRATAATPESARGTARVPSTPTVASVARTATEKGSFSKSRMSLVGVFGTPSARRALVRLPTGRYVKVKPGDRISGWQVSAIGESSLRISKGSRNQTLRVP